MTDIENKRDDFVLPEEEIVSKVVPSGHIAKFLKENTGYKICEASKMLNKYQHPHKHGDFVAKLLYASKDLKNLKEEEIKSATTLRSVLESMLSTITGIIISVQVSVHLSPVSNEPFEKVRTKNIIEGKEQLEIVRDAIVEISKATSLMPPYERNTMSEKALNRKINSECDKVCDLIRHIEYLEKYLTTKNKTEKTMLKRKLKAYRMRDNSLIGIIRVIFDSFKDTLSTMFLG